MRAERLLAACCAAVVLAGCSLPWSHPGTHPASRPRPTPHPVGAQFLLDGAAASGSVNLTPRSHLRVAFTQQVAPSAVSVTLDGQPVSADALAWAGDQMSFEIPVAAMTPYHPVQVTVKAPAPLVSPPPLAATMLATVPANVTTGIQAGFK